MKSKGIAYLLWFFFGILGVHRFYVGKYISGIIYLITLGLFGIGWFIDLFLLGGYVDTYNALYMAKAGLRNNNVNTNSVVVNVAVPAAAGNAAPATPSAAPATPSEPNTPVPEKNSSPQPHSTK